MADNPKIIILFGRSGSGKGTQAKLLIKEFGFEYLGSGDLLRKEAKKNDKIREILESGGRVPTEVIFNIWTDKIEEMKDDINENGLIIDGSPRSIEEAELISNVLEKYNWKDVSVILLDISEQEAFDRLTKRRICKKCGRLIPWVGEFKNIEACDKCKGELITRNDDNPDAIQERLEYYKKDVEPAVDYYEKKGDLIKIDGNQSIENVYQDIKKEIK